MTFIKYLISLFFLVFGNYSILFAQLQIVSIDSSTIDINGETFPTNGLVANINIAVQDQLTSFNGFQYVGYFNNDQRLCLGRRSLENYDWSIIEFLDYLKISEDAHNGISIGICKIDGTIHLSFDHHADTLNYKVSIPNIANDPLAYIWDASLFGSTQNYIIPDNILTKFTYPRFIPTPQGNLHLGFRLNYPGNGTFKFVDYNGENGIWENERSIISNEGLYLDSLYGEFPNISVYNNQIHYDSSGTLYTTFTWREKKDIDSIRYTFNHDIAYLTSEDNGLTWLNNNYEILADTSNLIANYTDPNINVANISPLFGMINNQAHGIDHNGIVHTIMNRSLMADSSYTITSKGTYFHYYRKALGEWKTIQMPFEGNRGKLVIDKFNNVIFMFYNQSSFNIAVATPSCNYNDWNIIHSEYNGARKFVFDYQRFAEDGVLSVLFQVHPLAPNLGMPTEIFLREYTFSFNDQNCLNCDVMELTPMEDIYSRAGIFANENFSDENFIAVKKSNDIDFNRISFLKFDLENLNTLDSIGKITLELTISAMSLESHVTPFGLFHVEDNSWDEDLLVWNNQPTINEAPINAHFGRQKLTWDITNIVKNELEIGESIISFAIKGMREGAQRNIVFRSKEYDILEDRPKIRIENNCDLINSIDNLDHEESSNKIKVYPNPSNNILNIELEEEISGTLIIYDIFGQIIRKTLIRQNDKQEVNVQNISSGMYIIVLKDKNGRSIHSEKVLINQN